MADGFEVAEVWRARGRGFQMAVAQHDGQVVHFTGQVAWDANERVVGVGDVEAQTRQCFDNIARLLAAVGGELADIVSITTYFTDRAQLSLIQKVRTEYLPAETAPVSTSVMVAGLGHEDFLVELTPVAVIPFDRYTPLAAPGGRP
ncbi:MAG: RidA family protein [Hyphomicrobiaceae bacterium]